MTVSTAQNDKLRTAHVIKWLPHIFGRNQTSPVDLIGATIVQFGTFQETGLVETDGLVIDYIPAGACETRRTVLAFNDTAMWEVANLGIER